MNDIAIQFDNVGKLYKLGLVGTGSLVHDLNRWWKTSILRQEDPYLKIGETNDRSKKGSSDYVWALKDITFDVKQGDVVGIIGKNGAGKSTLLKLLSRVTSPTTGAIRAKGRIASLLEVGTGFHPELTGRENIYMNGSIMGMTRHEIDRKLDEIVDFAGVERYIDTPVKRYSSGMTVRLGFAVAAFLEPEILVVDEVLAVGDAEFQKKAIGKMQDVSKGEGRTVLFVSHNMGSMQRLCNRGILLENGTITMQENIMDCIEHYLKDDKQTQISSLWQRPMDAKDSLFMLRKAFLINANGKISSSFSCDEDFILCLDVNVLEIIPNVYGWMCLIDAKTGIEVWVSDSNDVINNKLQTLPCGNHQIRLRFPARTLAPGSYIIKLNFQSSYNFSGFYIDRNEEILSFELHDYATYRGDKRKGYYSKLIDWEF